MMVIGVKCFIKQRLLFCCVMLGMALPMHVSANIPQPSSTPIYMEAEKLGYDRDHGVVVALGKVEVVQGEYVLFADKITYNQQTNEVKAEGNISLLQPDGNVMFADQMELQDDMKQGIINDISIRMKNDAVFAAREANRISETETELTKAVFSPCKVCINDDGTDGTPLWQLKADKVTIDEEKEQISYRNARMEVLGVPLLYSPYFSHAMPGASSKSGFLIPEYESSSQLGTGARIPYYFALSPTQDATITSRITSGEGPILEGEYRQRTDNGYFELNGSATYPNRRDNNGAETDGRDFRGHLFAKGEANINEKWRWGFDIQHSSDDTYLERYGYGNQDLLTSSVDVERIDDRDYFRVRAIGFQGLEEDDDSDTTPLIVPAVDTHIESEALALNSRFYFDQNALFLTRDQGAETARISLTGGYRVPYTTDNGHAFEIDASIRADSYNVTERDEISSANEPTEETIRAVPQVAVSWRYPLVKQINNASLVLEPHAKLIVASNGNNSGIISNEDSRINEFSALGLFSSNRFAGLDLVENGTRGIYGIRTQLQTSSNHYINLVLGQEIQLSGDRVFPSDLEGSGDQSDFVGQLNVDYSPFSLAYGFRIDDETLELHRNEVNAGFNYRGLSLSTDYIQLQSDPELGTREEISGVGSLQLTDNWRVFANGQRNLTNNSSTYVGAGLAYSNECVTITTRMQRSFIRDRDIEPDVSYLIRLSLSNLN